MKKLITSIAAIVLLSTACQKNTELKDVEKEKIVHAVKETSDNFISSFSRVYDNESLAEILTFYTENVELHWKTDPVFMVYNAGIVAATKDDLVKLSESIIQSRISTSIDVKERYFSVLSGDKVLEVGKWEASLLTKDSTVWEQGISANSILWTKSDGTWKIQYFHQSDKHK